MLFKQLSEFLEREINKRISPKMKMQFEGDLRGYQLLRTELEEKVILSTNWLAYFLENTTTDIPIEDLKTLDDSSLLTFHQITIEFLKKLIDGNQEKEPLGESLCDYVRTIYSDTKAECETRFPEFPKGDGFADYLDTREQREGKSEARKTGAYCIFCGADSKNIRKNGDKWKCDFCGKQFRKKV